MKAIQVIDRQPQLIDTPVPGDDKVRVRVVSSSICGSDLHLIANGWAEGMIPGHEFAGYAPDGRAVAVEPVMACGDCHSCRDGYLAHCASGPEFIGVSSPGGMAEYVAVPADSLVPLPTGLDVANAALVEPLAVAFHGLDQGRVREGERVLVIGAGAIGLATAAALASRGLAFDITARHPHQQRAARGFGGRLQAGEGYDVVIDAVGTGESLAEGVNRLRARGRLVMLGTLWDSAVLPMNWTMKEIALIPAMTYRSRVAGRTFEEAARALLERRDIAPALITHRFPLDGVREAFAAAADRASGAIKVCFDLQ